jgi:hypothetical protein
MHDARFTKFLLRGVVFMGISLTQVACSILGIRSEENPKYEVLVKEGDKELRSYASYIVAKTSMKDDSDASRSEAFRVLAGYIFGGNEKKQSLSMTAPVTERSEPQSESISMTAPVSSSRSQEGWIMTFMMPSKYQLAELPKPKDSRVQFEVVPAKLIATLRYSGLGRTSTNQQKAIELRQWVDAMKKYRIVSDPIRAGYDPPWTLPFLRRLEIMFELNPL